VALLPALMGCGSETASSDRAPDAQLASGLRYERDADYRRQELASSLVNPDNGYSRLRLERYTDTGWGALPEWNPRTSGIEIGEGETPPSSASDRWAPLDLEAVPWERRALVQLGEQAFFRYPIQKGSYVRQVLRGSAAPSDYGLWLSQARLGGIVWTEWPGDLIEPAFTCAACHASVEAYAVIAGRNNADIDLDALIADYAMGSIGGVQRPGRLDPTRDGVDNPSTISDLRAIASQVNLHRAASVRNGLIALAIRIETLVITSLDEAVRPPRKLAFALALYLWQLEPLPLRTPDESALRGRAVFSEHCARCHMPPEFSGPAVALDVVGTDPSVGMSPERFTGFYRVPSLRGVGDRRRLLATGAVFDVRELLDPTRVARGHPFGLDLDEPVRADLLSFLETL
jgi:hypothetical protein